MKRSKKIKYAYYEVRWALNDEHQRNLRAIIAPWENSDFCAVKPCALQIKVFSIVIVGILWNSALDAFGKPYLTIFS